MQVTSSSMSRIVSYLERFDCGTISAYRGYEGQIIQQLGTTAFEQALKKDPHAFDEHKVKQAVNKKNSQLLKQKLLALGYGVIAIYGVYKELGSPVESKESSWFVFDYKQKGTLKKHLLFLGNQFEQDSITYADAGTDFDLYNTSPFSEQPNQPLHKAKGDKQYRFNSYSIGSLPNSEQQFFSRLGNKPFYWKDYSVKEVEATCEKSVLIGYTQAQARIGFMHSIPLAKIWTNKRYEERANELKQFGINFNSDVVMTADDVYVDWEEIKRNSK